MIHGIYSGPGSSNIPWTSPGAFQGILDWEHGEILEKGPGYRRLTSAGGQGAAPLAVGQALGLGSSLQAEAGVALEFGHVVEVELGALGEPVGGVAGVATGDGCKHKTEMLLRLFPEKKRIIHWEKVLEVGESKNPYVNPKTRRCGACSVEKWDPTERTGFL